MILFEFRDAIKEGDGNRLFNLYKLPLLIYKCNGNFKYAYVVLLYLVKCIAILPKFHAFRLKWNRFFNAEGGMGKNISLDLEKEFQNKDLKVVLVALGPNLDEGNAERTAGCLEVMRLIQTSVDQDCGKHKGTSHRTTPKEEEAVSQILSDLMEVKAFSKEKGRDGYPSFPKFERSLLYNLDYRDLHRWMKEHLQLWGSVYQQKE